MGSETKRSYAVIGTGAVGGYYGARLQDAGHDVHFLLHSDYEHVCRHGLRLDSVDGDLVLPTVNAYRYAHDIPPCDVVIVALKAYANAVLENILPGVTRGGGTVLLLQNGMGGEEQLARWVPDAAIVGGLCFLCSNKVGPGHIRHLDYGRVTLGAYRGNGEPAGITQAMRDLVTDLSTTGREITMVEDLRLARWKKLVWNIPFNGLTVLLHTTTDHLVRDPDTRHLSHALMQEVVAGAAAEGRTVPAAFVEQMMTDTERMTPYRPSMLLDYEAGRSMEVEAIYGEPVRAAARAGAAMPHTDSLYRCLSFLDHATGA